ncbi:MAG: histidine--tRNA ligase [Gammaproteobacteria bacterium]
MIRAVRGMNDILPDTTPLWQRLEHTARVLLLSYGYEEIRLPILEQTALFERSIGETTDIVEKEMYTFTDRNGDSLSLRPEGTAGAVRAVLQHNPFRNQAQRLWYMGPMFRRERPQKGRYRQFYQIGAEAFGMPGPDIDAELIILTRRLWRLLGLGGLQLEINTLGTATTRARFRQDLVSYFSASAEKLDQDSRRRLHSNPLRILDSKNPELQEVIQGAPTFERYVDPGSEQHFRQLREILEHNDIDYRVNPRLVRGLDYYSKTVFEWLTTELGAQGAVCGGGRYDGLVEHFGGEPTPAVGFAIGMDRLIELLRETPLNDIARTSNEPHLYLIVGGEKYYGSALRVAETVREAMPHIRLVTHCGSDSFKSQFKRADKSGARIALLLGEDEVSQGMVTVKHLRISSGQVTVPQSELIACLEKELARL